MKRGPLSAEFGADALGICGALLLLMSAFMPWSAVSVSGVFVQSLPGPQVHWALAAGVVAGLALWLFNRRFALFVPSVYALAEVVAQFVAWVTSRIPAQRPPDAFAPHVVGGRLPSGAMAQLSPNLIYVVLGATLALVASWPHMRRALAPLWGGAGPEYFEE